MAWPWSMATCASRRARAAPGRGGGGAVGVDGGGEEVVRRWMVVVSFGGQPVSGWCC